KEAILKSSGLGFSYPSNQFSVVSSGNHSLSTVIDGEVTANKQCNFTGIFCDERYMAALAILQ
ncbi:MAG TPA: hypothetical protein VF338_01545, partial [Leptolinea sp.]